MHCCISLSNTVSTSILCKKHIINSWLISAREYKMRSFMCRQIVYSNVWIPDAILVVLTFHLIIPWVKLPKRGHDIPEEFQKLMRKRG